MHPELLSQADVEKLAALVPGWSISPCGKRTHTGLAFASFREAFAFMAEIALEAHRLDHHPEWSNVYNRVRIILTTHDADGLTGRDLALAQAISAALDGRTWTRLQD